MAKVSVFGLGKVGHTLAACLGASGHNVVCYDVNAALVAAVNSRTLNSLENGVAERLDGLGTDRLRATDSAVEAIRESDATFSREQIETLASLLGEGIDGADEHIVADVVEMAAKSQPHAGWGDVIGSALSRSL